jgi:RNA polymerase sigma factor (sigma-70 family)
MRTSFSPENPQEPAQPEHENTIDEARDNKSIPGAVDLRLQELFERKKISRDEPSSPEDVLYQQELSAIVERALSTLTDKQRKVIELYYGFRGSESGNDEDNKAAIARETGINRISVIRMLKQAQIKLAKELSHLGKDYSVKPAKSYEAPVHASELVSPLNVSMLMANALTEDQIKSLPQKDFEEYSSSCQMKLRAVKSRLANHLYNKLNNVEVADLHQASTILDKQIKLCEKRERGDFETWAQQQ